MGGGPGGSQRHRASPSAVAALAEQRGTREAEFANNKGAGASPSGFSRSTRFTEADCQRAPEHPSPSAKTAYRERWKRFVIDPSAIARQGLSIRPLRPWEASPQ